MNPSFTRTQLVKYFLQLGATGFGGPVALVSAIHRDLVETRKWISEEDYKEGLTLAQLAPGPLAAQLAIYLGFIHFGVLGATLVGVAFVIPSFIMVVLLGWAYTLFGGLPWMQAVFYGVGSAVIGIIAISSVKLTKKTIGNDWLSWTFFVVMAVTTVVYKSEILWLIVAAGVISWFVKAPPRFLQKNKVSFFVPLMLQVPVHTSDFQILGKLALYFSMAGAFVFGSGLAIVPFLYGGVVHEHQWLSEKEFLDAVAVAMITPGPVIITVGFIGYLVAGFPGACVAAFATFLPCYLFTVLPAPYFKKYGKNPAIKAFVDGVTAAAIGALAGAVGVLALRQLTDWVTIGIAVTTVLILVRFKKIQEPFVILAAAIFGLIFKLLLTQ